VVLTSGVNWVNRKRIFQLAAAGRLPAIYTTSEFSRDGGLMSYGLNLLDLTRQATDYVDKILRGRSPADLPVEQPTELELIVNLKTAKALVRGDPAVAPAARGSNDQVGHERGAHPRSMKMALSLLGRRPVNVVVTWYRESGSSMTWEPFGTPHCCP